MRRTIVRRRTLVVTALLVGALLALVATSGFAVAQTATPEPAAASATDPCAAIGTRGEGRLSDLLDALVEEGIVDQNQADRIRQFLTTRAQERCYRALVLPPTDVVSTAADTLGLTTSQLMTDLREGKSLAQIASERNVSRDTLKNALLQTARQNADALVQQGVLTQDRADRAVQSVQQNLDDLLDQVGVGCFGRHGGWGRGHHGFFAPYRGEHDSNPDRSSWRGLSGMWVYSHS